MKENKKQIINRNKGITLVALVITIIILLILAGISIASLTGSGLFSKAREAEGKYTKSQLKEELELGIFNLQIEKMSKGKKLEREDLIELANIGATVLTTGIPTLR